MTKDPAKPLPPEALRAVSGGQDALFTWRNGTPGNDTIVAGDGRDHLRGGSGDDLLMAGGGEDVVRGHGGNDYGSGGAGSDNVYGDDGEDTLDGGLADGAADSLLGGAGNDLLLWSPGGGNDTLFGGFGLDRVQVGLGPWQPFNPLPGEIWESLKLDSGAAICVTGSLDASTPGTILITFVTESGLPFQSASGSFTLRGETVRFEGVEALQIVFAMV